MANQNRCDCCEEEAKPVVKILTLTDGEGVLLDRVRFCGDCWQDREIIIKDKSIDY
jgi:hypothetical protein